MFVSVHFFSPKEVGKKIPFGGSFSVCEKYLVAQTVKRLPTMRETWVRSLGREDPLEEEIATPSILLGESHGQRSLVGHRVTKSRTQLSN